MMVRLSIGELSTCILVSSLILLVGNYCLMYYASIQWNHPSYVQASIDFNTSGTNTLKGGDRLPPTRVPEVETQKSHGKKEVSGAAVSLPPNVLFLIADDMRPEIRATQSIHSVWQEPGIVTPHLDLLASQSLVLTRAYSQFSWCNPSRASLLTSRRPDTTMVHNNSVHFRQVHPHLVTLPQYFKQHGYHTVGMGKVFHLHPNSQSEDNQHSWSEPMLRLQPGTFLPDGQAAWEAVDQTSPATNLPLRDELVTQVAKDTLARLATHQQHTRKPFFLAVGFKKPHMNWYFPQRFLEAYSGVNVSLPVNKEAPAAMPQIAWLDSYEVSSRPELKVYAQHWTRNHTLPDWIIRDLRRAYFSAVTYIDDLIGQLLQQLDHLGLENNTIVSFLGDHGFHLGEHNIFGKQTAFDIANRCPLLLRVPGVTSGGVVRDELVELVDVFPTLAEMAGLPPVPRCPPGTQASRVGLCTEGTSLLPLLSPPPHKWKERVFYQFPHICPSRGLYCMGYSMRTEQYRYTHWAVFYYKGVKQVDWKKSCGRELYDHVADPLETRNLAGLAAVREVERQLEQQLRAGWQAALPGHPSTPPGH